jgi:hypothetical protein
MFDYKWSLVIFVLVMNVKFWHNVMKDKELDQW